MEVYHHTHKVFTKVQSPLTIVYLLLFLNTTLEMNIRYYGVDLECEGVEWGVVYCRGCMIRMRVW